MSNILLGGIKFDEKKFESEKQITKSLVYYEKFKAIVFDYIKLKYESGEYEKGGVIPFKSSALVGTKFKVEKTDYCFTAPTIAACIERFNDEESEEENTGVQILSKVKNVPIRGKKIVISQRYLETLNEMIASGISNVSDDKK